MPAMRINGFSGMDVDSMVKSMMKAKSVPLDKLNQQKTYMEWQRDSYREMNSKMYDFRNNKLATYRQSAALNTQVAVVTGNADAVAATANADANGIPMTVSVKQLATADSYETPGIGFGFKSDQSLGEIAKNIKYTPGMSGTLTDEELKQEYTIRLNGRKTMTFKGSDSISSVIAQINANQEFGVNATFDEITGKFKISSKETGDISALSFDTTSDNPTDTREVNSLIKLFQPVGSKQIPTSSEITDGQNAIFYIGSSSNKIESKSNSVTYNGVQMTLKAVTGGTTPFGADDKTFTVGTKVDPQKALDTIKSFVNDYNEILKLFSNKLDENKYRDFTPLTTEQKSAMTEDQIKTWEAKAKSGLLKNNDILSSTVQSMRGIISAQMGRLSSIGITTGAYYENGKLTINEEKLKKAIENQPQQVLDIFQGTGATGTKDSIFGKLYSTMDDAMGKMTDRAGTTKFSGDLNAKYKEESVMGKQLKEYNTKIRDMQKRLATAEDNYYRQFTAMETAMNKYQSQSSGLLSSLGMASK